MRSCDVLCAVCLGAFVNWLERFANNLNLSQTAPVIATMQLGALVFVSVAACVGARLHSQRAASFGNSTLDINQKVYIGGTPVFGDNVAGTLGVCTNFATQDVESSSAPVVKVCGTGIKATIYLRGDPPAHNAGNDCVSYHTYQWQVGKCDKSMASETCDIMSPAVDHNVAAAQAYIIEQC